MSDITQRADAGVEGKSVLYLRPQTRLAGVAIKAGQPTYIDSNGLLQLAVSTVQYVTGSAAQSLFDGVPASDIASGSAGEIYGRGAVVEIAASGLTFGGNGSAIWISNTAGKWANAKVATNDTPVAHAISATQIVLDRGL